MTCLCHFCKTFEALCRSIISYPYCAFWDLVVVIRAVRVEGEWWPKHPFDQPLGSICNEKLTIQVVSDSTSILHFGHHVLNRIPGKLQAHHNRWRHMFLQKQQGSIQIWVVKLIWDAPTNRTKLPSFLNNTVEKGDGIEKCSPFLMVHLNLQSKKYLRNTIMNANSTGTLECTDICSVSLIGKPIKDKASCMFMKIDKYLNINQYQNTYIVWTYNLTTHPHNKLLLFCLYLYSRNGPCPRFLGWSWWYRSDVVKPSNQQVAPESPWCIDEALGGKFIHEPVAFCRFFIFFLEWNI